MRKRTDEAETIFQNAINYWWKSKEKNLKGASVPQGGVRHENLRGDTMDGFRDVIALKLEELGIRKEDIFFGNSLADRASNLPAYFRATKNWDVVVCKNAQIDREGEFTLEPPKLIAAIEFKSQTSSIGNNQNNRIEESIGNAVDFWEAYEKGTLGPLLPRPWLGYLFVGRYEEGDESKTVKVNQPLIPVDKIYAAEDRETKSELRIDGVSYSERYRIFLERMIGKKLYDGASFLITNEGLKSKEPNYVVLYETLSGQVFMDGLIKHVGAHYFD